MEHTVRIDALGNLFMDDGRLPYARLEWYADGHTFYLLGAFSRTKYEQAGNLVLSFCIGCHIPAIAVRRVSK